MASVHARQRRVAAVAELKFVAVMRHASVVIAVAGAASPRTVFNGKEPLIYGESGMEGKASRSETRGLSER